MKISELFFRTDARNDARALVLEYHYSHTWPPIVKSAMTWHRPGGLFGDRGEAIAACVWGIPVVTWREPVLELQRLVRTPTATIPLTSLVATSAGEIRRRQLADLLISYADPGQGHHGGIYQAGSWEYTGLWCLNGGPVAFLVNGKRVHSRQVGRIYGTRSKALLSKHPRDIIVPIERTGKHLYWRTLNRRGKAKAKRLGLQSLPYPKPALDIAAVHDRTGNGHDAALVNGSEGSWRAPLVSTTPLD